MDAHGPVVLSSQHRSVHETPCTAADYDRVLAAAAGNALAHQHADGNLELDPADEDIGDTSLGVTSLLALAWARGLDVAGLADGARRGLDFFLGHRVFRTDNPGYPNLRRRHSGVPYARYVIADGEHPFGDWPSTAWALLHAVNVLRLGDGLCTDKQLDELAEVAQGYWTWLTEITRFNPQDTANQAYGAVVGALMLAVELERRGSADDAARIRAEATRRYQDLRAERLPDRGFLLPGEHGGAWDGNYGPVSLSFLAQAHRVTGEPVYLRDGLDLAAYLDMRMSVRGFDLGGSRYLEQHVGFEGTLGLRYFSRHLDADLGRYLGSRKHPYLFDAGAGDGTGAPHGHFAFMTVWAMEDETPWRSARRSANGRYQLRHGAVSVAFDAGLTPHLLDVAGVAVIGSALDRQHGIGAFYRDPQSAGHLLTRPLAPVRTVELDTATHRAKLVVKAVATWTEKLLTTQTLYVTDGVALHLVTLLDAAGLPPGSTPSLALGLPYAAPGPVPDRYCKITAVTTSDGAALSFGAEGAELTTTGSVAAGALAMTANGPLRVTNPRPAPGLGAFVYSSGTTLHQTIEQAAFALAADPHGYGNPEQAWTQLHHTNLIEALDGEPVAGTGLTALTVTYAPAGDPPAGRPQASRHDDGILITLPGIALVVGDPAGDERGEPILYLT